MSDKAPDQEPSIEEILASIRQIISDDDEQETTAAEAPPPPPSPKKKAEPPPSPPKEDVLELTDDMREEPAPEPPPMKKPILEVELQDARDRSVPVADEPAEAPEAAEAILSDSAKRSALSSMAKLAGNMPVSRRSGYDGVTLEDIVRELLHPMLRDWLDNNLPPMVERLVQKELEKLARRAMDD